VPYRPTGRTDGTAARGPLPRPTGPARTGTRLCRLQDLIRQRYTHDGATVAELAAALHCAEITITAEMDRIGTRRRAEEDRLVEGRQALAAKRARVRVEREGRARELGFPDVASHLRERHHRQRWPQRLIAEELGVTVRVVARLVRREGVSGLRGVTVSRAAPRSRSRRNRPCRASRTPSVARSNVDVSTAAAV
jgi:IS30 family transposase